MKSMEGHEAEPMEPGLEPSGPVRQSHARVLSAVDDLRACAEAANDREARALLEMAAEVLEGIAESLRRFSDRSEPAWHPDDVPQPS